MNHLETFEFKKIEIYHFTPLRYGLEINSIEKYNS
jgi:hypothetical protein